MEKIIDQLKALDLTKYPKDEIRALINLFGKFGVIQMILHPGKSIIRARANLNGERFSTRSEVSYKPQKFNTSYLRASTPNMTMFYAGTIPESIKEGEVDNARIVSTLEASNLLRDKNQEGEQVITFSKWVVTNDIPLIAVCYHKDFTEKNSHTKELYEAYNGWAKGLPDDFRAKSLVITTFLASEFAKREIRGDFDYMISAIFSEMTINKGQAGIYYPSVRTDGMGYNVAIAPHVVDTSLKLVAVGECTMYKKGDRTIVDNETVCIIEDDTQPFKLIPIDKEHHIGRERILQELNGEL